MKKGVKLFVIYFPVILVTGQVLVNLLSFVAYDWYLATGFYLNTFFGTNVFFALFLVAFCFMFRMCAVSRWAAVAECAFSVNYLIVQQDNTYNIMFQVIVGMLSLIATFWHYVKKFPLCNFSVGVHFVKDALHKGSCKKSLDHWDRKVRNATLRSYHEKRNA